MPELVEKSPGDGKGRTGSEGHVNRCTWGSGSRRLIRTSRHGERGRGDRSARSELARAWAGPWKPRRGFVRVWGEVCSGSRVVLSSAPCFGGAHSGVPTHTRWPRCRGRTAHARGGPSVRCVHVCELGEGRGRTLCLSARPAPARSGELCLASVSRETRGEGDPGQGSATERRTRVAPGRTWERALILRGVGGGGGENPLARGAGLHPGSLSWRESAESRT